MLKSVSWDDAYLLTYIRSYWEHSDPFLTSCHRIMSSVPPGVDFFSATLLYKVPQSSFINFVTQLSVTLYITVQCVVAASHTTTCRRCVTRVNTTLSGHCSGIPRHHTLRRSAIPQWRTSPAGFPSTRMWHQAHAVYVDHIINHVYISPCPAQW